MSKHQRIVLHIDDDEEDRELFEEALKRVDPNIVVQQADNGSAALSILKQSKHAHDLPCLIVLDLNMPGMNGKDVLREIRKDEELAALPLVIYTTATEKAYKDFIEKENVQLLSKPSTPSELFSTVRKMLSYCPPN
jgi:CheY-like chemotaxis protein